MQVRAEQEASKRGAGGAESDEEEAPALAKPVALPGVPAAPPVSRWLLGCGQEGGWAFGWECERSMRLRRSSNKPCQRPAGRRAVAWHVQKLKV